MARSCISGQLKCWWKNRDVHKSQMILIQDVAVHKEAWRSKIKRLYWAFQWDPIGYNQSMSGHRTLWRMWKTQRKSRKGYSRKAWLKWYMRLRTVPGWFSDEDRIDNSQLFALELSSLKGCFFSLDSLDRVNWSKLLQLLVRHWARGTQAWKFVRI